jgi:hypothetical protein
MREAHPNADDATLQDQTTVLIRAMDYNVAIRFSPSSTTRKSSAVGPISQSLCCHMGYDFRREFTTIEIALARTYSHHLALRNRSSGWSTKVTCTRGLKQGLGAHQHRLRSIYVVDHVCL